MKLRVSKGKLSHGILTIGHDQADVVAHLPVAESLLSRSANHALLVLAFEIIVDGHLAGVVIVLQVVSNKPLAFALRSQ